MLERGERTEKGEGGDSEVGKQWLTRRENKGSSRRLCGIQRKETEEDLMSQSPASSLRNFWKILNQDTYLKYSKTIDWWWMRLFHQEETREGCDMGL